MPRLSIELPSHEEQMAFNLRRWAEVLADPELSKLEGRVETDRHGHIFMSAPASAEHGGYQADLAYLLRTLLPAGKCYGECPISTPDGVRVADAAWISRDRLAAIGSHPCLPQAPEICVEIISPTNSRRELAEKKALYFAAGAEEVWFCDGHGKLTFYVSADSAGDSASRICPQFPSSVQL